MPWNYKNRRRPDSRLKVTPSEKKLNKLTKMVKPFNYKTPKKEGDNDATPSTSCNE